MVPDPLMPKGVEHSGSKQPVYAVDSVPDPLMPKGVEHRYDVVINNGTCEQFPIR